MEQRKDIVVAIIRGVITFFLSSCLLGIIVLVIVPDLPPEDSEPGPKYRDILGIITIPLSMILGGLESLRYWKDDRKRKIRLPDLCEKR